MASEERRGNLLALGLSQAVRLGAGFLVSVLIMRGLGVEAFGVYGTLTTLIGLCSFGANMGLERYLNGEVSRREERARALVGGALLAVGLFSGLTALVVLGLARGLLGGGEALLAAGLGALGLGLRALAMMPVAAFHGLRRMAFGVGPHILGRLVLVAGTLLLLRLGLGVPGVFLAQVLDGAVTLVGVLWIFRARLGSPDFGPGARELPALLRRAPTFGLNALYTSLYLSVDVIMLQQMRGEAEVGLYRAAAVGIALLPQVADTIVTGIFPRMARHLGDRAAAGEELRFLSRVLLALSLPAALGGVILAEPLVVLLGGEEFAEAGLAFAIMAPMLPFRFLTNAYGMTLTSLDRQEERTRGALLAAILNIGLNLFVIPRFGAAGAAATTLLTDVLLVAWLRWRVGGLVEGAGLLAVLLRALVPALPMGLVVLQLRELPVLLVVGVGALVYAALGYLLGAWHPRDLSRLRRV